MVGPGCHERGDPHHRRGLKARVFEAAEASGLPTGKRMVMKVQELMTKEVRTCAPDSDLATVAQLMWDADCGSIPVVDSRAKVVGVITDRDICMAAATTGRSLRHIAVREVMSGHLHACFPTDDLATALATMSGSKVRRLPVIDQEGGLKGILSMNDLILASGAARNGLAPKDVVAALQAVSEHRSLVAVR